MRSSFRAIAHARHADWEYLFFHKPIDQSVIANLRSNLEQEFRNKDYKRQFNDLAKILKSERPRNRIKQIFGETLQSPEDINSTSLCLYSGPFSSTSFLSGEMFGAFEFPPSSTGIYGSTWTGDFPIQCSILYSGDANFSIPLNRRELRDFLGESKYGTPLPRRWEQISILQVPHHGSRNNWGAGSASEFHNSWSVFCADERHKGFEHPHREVLVDLINRRPHLANKHQGWSWHGVVRFP